MALVRTAVAVLLFASASRQAVGHDTWVRAAVATAQPGAAIRFDLTSGMAFPALESAIRKERVLQARIRLHGATTALARFGPAPKSLRFDVTPASSGTATVWVELHPRALVLTPAQVEEYLHEIGASEAIRARWAAIPEPKRWREVYTKHAKTFVRVGAPDVDASWGEPVGLNLELLPESDPVALHEGGRLTVRLLKGGKPFAGLAVAAERSQKRVLETTDAEGRVTFTLDQAGPWLLAATELREAPQGGWESDFSTLTLEVSPQR